MNFNWTPAELAEYDQYLAGADANIDTIVAALRRSIKEEGEPTAMARLTLTLVERSDPVSVLGLTTALLRRLAKSERDGKWLKRWARTSCPVGAPYSQSPDWSNSTVVWT